MGIGVEEILEAVVKKVPPPADTREEPLRALIFDSYYDAYRGVIVYFRVVDGSLAAGDVVKLMATGKEYCVDEVGVLVPEKVPCARLQAGDVGYLAASIKAVADARVGDTITLKKRQAGEALPGYQEATPMVFCGLFPTDADAFADLREALGRLQLNDAALRYEPEVSPAMGFGFRCGFLGWVVFLLQVFSFQVFSPPGSRFGRARREKASVVGGRRDKEKQTHFLSLSHTHKKKTSLLHMEIVQERLEREYDLDLITTAPTVAYRVKLPSAGRHAGGSAAAAAAAAVAANAPLPPSAASSGGATGEGVVKGASGASTASQLVVINNDAIDDPLLVAVDNPASVPVRSVSISGKLKEREKVGRNPPPKKTKKPQPRPFPKTIKTQDARDYIEEPYVRMEIITPKDYVGPLMELAQNRRGEFIDMRFLTEARTTLLYDVPLAEVVTDFFDELKSRSRGYASMEYSVTGYRKSDLVRLDVKINGEVAEPLAAIVHRDNAYRIGEFEKRLFLFFEGSSFPSALSLGRREEISPFLPF